MPPKSRRAKGKRAGAKSGNSVDRLMTGLARATGSTTTVIPADMNQRRQNFNLVQSPPKNFMTMIYWVRESVAAPISLASTTTVVSENNFSFTLNSLSNVSSLTTVFDQYCIYSVTVTFTYGSINTGFLAPLDLYTAIDYDNTTNIGLSGIQNFASYNESIIVPGTSLVRTVKPCVALAAYTGAFTGYTTGRVWIDCNSTTVNHYGLRTIIGIAGSALALSVSTSYIVGFRNTHG